MNTLVLNKENTIFDGDQPRQGAADFLRLQTAKARHCILATSAPSGEAAAQQLNGLSRYVDGCFGQDELNGEGPHHEYKNPTLWARGKEGHFERDLHLLRQRISPHDFLAPQMVMLGGRDDITNADSDPHTPLVVVDGGGVWLAREHTRLLLDALFEPRSNPFDVFERLMREGRPEEIIERADVVRQAVTRVSGRDFPLGMTAMGGRFIFEYNDGAK